MADAAGGALGAAGVGGEVCMGARRGSDRSRAHGVRVRLED
ncbi:hypothetical protein ABG982_05780 [Collinsella aerofaciens]